MLSSRWWRACIATGLIASVILLPAVVFAAATGKIVGTVTDKKSGDPIVGASVLIVGTKIGAMTDFDGNFRVQQVEPGEYTIKISAVGYQSVEITELSVKADQNTEASVSLEEAISDIGETITVKGKTDILNIREVANQRTITKESIQKQPVTTVDELLESVAGITTNQSGEVYIRGGRAGEVSYIVDGVPMNDPLGGLGQAGANLSLVSGSIQEFTVIKDGFDPEYGDAVSGIVKITTQTGSKDNTKVNMQYITDDFGNKTLNKYSRNNDFARIALSGPDPIFKNKILPALGLNFLAEKEFTYYFYAEVDKDDGVFQYDSYDTPNTRRTDGFFNLFGVKVPERLKNRYYWMSNLKFRPTQNLKFILSYKQSETRNTRFGWDYRYSSQTAPVEEGKWRTISLEVSQAVSNTMSYEGLISYAENGYVRKPGDPNNPGVGLDPDQFSLDYEWETFQDRNGNGIYDAPEPIVNLYPDTGNYGTGFTGPGYTPGEPVIHTNLQGAVDNPASFRFNNNHEIDSLEGEPFIDLNGNGVWDQGDFLEDKNGNGILDQNRLGNINLREPEPYTDGDSIIGEPFTDFNGNGVFDLGVDGFVMSPFDDNQDLNHNGRHDGPNDPWTVGTPYIDRNGNGIYDPKNQRYDPGEQFVDVNGNGRWDAGGQSNFLTPGSYDADAIWHNRNTKTLRGEIKMFKQLGKHEFKVGASVRQLNFLFQEIEKRYVPYTGRADGGPYPDRGAFRDMFEYEPWAGTVYFRDKLEYGSMIASLGIRWDFFIQDKNKLVPVAKADDLGSGVILGDRQKFSPRIGFSYPISDKAKVHFNYGHFYQLPLLTYMYARNTTAIDQNSVVGNYNLDYKKTVQYSFGVKYAVSESYSVDISGYFKDEFDKINSASVVVGGLNRQQYQNSDYGRSRGFEFLMEKRGGGYVNGSLSYVYAFAFGKASEASRDYSTPFELSREPLSESALDNDIRHVLKSNIQFFVPNTVKPRLFGLPIPNGWSLSVQTTIESGRPFTPDRSYPNISSTSGEDIQNNSLRKPAIINFDVRFTKDFQLVGLDYSFILWIENIFNNRNVLNVYSNTGRPDTQQNQSQIIKGGTEYDLNPANWDYGRQIRVGLEINL